MMLIFYIICGALIFALSGIIMQFNRRAIYRRRIIRHFITTVTPPCEQPFTLTAQQEQKIKQCFLKGTSIQNCIDKL